MTKATRGGLVRGLAWVLLVAFTLQSYVAQTHMHRPAVAEPGVVIGKVLTKSGGPGHGPIDNGTTDCPMCQAVAHASAFVAPPALIVSLPVAWVEGVAPLFVVAVKDAATAHPWQSRAPPRV